MSKCVDKQFQNIFFFFGGGYTIQSIWNYIMIDKVAIHICQA